MKTNSNHHVVVVADCDHPSIDIEKNVLRDVTDNVAWLACKTEDEIISQCANAHGILIQYAPMSRRVLEKLPLCKTIVRYGVGLDTIDLQAASELGIKVCNVPDYGTHEVSDHALALMLCLTRKISFANDRVKKGVWDFRLMHPVFRHQVQTIGIVGVGRIGKAMAEKAHAIGMKVIAYDPYVNAESLPDYIKLVDFDCLLEKSDVISIHCPLSADTCNMFDRHALFHMKPTAYLINTARGGIVDENALNEALFEHRIAGAAMDVLKNEPGTLQNPLFQRENFLCTPHMAWHSEESAFELKRKAAEEVRRILKGEAPLYQANA